MSKPNLRTRFHQLFHDSLTEDDCVHYCGAKVFAFIALLGFLAGGLYCLYFEHNAATLSSFGTGLGTVLGGSGILIAGKQMSQHRDAPPQI